MRESIDVNRKGKKKKEKYNKNNTSDSNPLQLSSSKAVVCGHCLMTLSLTINQIVKWLSSLPILM